MPPMQSSTAIGAVTKKKYKAEVPPEVAETFEKLEAVAPQIDAFRRWLYNVVTTSPFTLTDAFELKTMIKQQLGDASVVDVYTRGGAQVFVRVQLGGLVIERAIDVV